MNTTLTPATRLSRVLTDWLRPNALVDRDLFDLGSNLLSSRPGVNVPSVNIKETPNAFVLEIAAPGLRREDFQLEVDDHTLTVSAETEDEENDEKSDNGYFRREYSYDAFSRSFVLPENVKEGAIEAKYERGILIVTVPKATESRAKPVKKIAVL